ncbi:MAG: SAM-dependent methyltransferase, partial [Anaerolineales bacterium]|nr:SAM-dependent methyltransferase [Anaerolineales bacterium]MDW8163085.1 N-6 DNA methylase [Anaerolineales bacterium]
NLFYNTTAPGVIIVVNRRKRHPGEIMLINASQLFAKGRPKNYLTDEHIETIASIYHAWGDPTGANRDAPLHAIITREEAARNDYNLSPSRYVSINGSDEVLPLEEALVRLEEAEEERAKAERALREVLFQLGLKTEEAE